MANDADFFGYKYAFTSVQFVIKQIESLLCTKFKMPTFLCSKSNDSNFHAILAAEHITFGSKSLSSLAPACYEVKVLEQLVFLVADVASFTWRGQHRFLHSEFLVEVTHVLWMTLCRTIQSITSYHRANCMTVFLTLRAIAAVMCLVKLPQVVFTILCSQTLVYDHRQKIELYCIELS